jgi:hypothetical protein
MIPRRTIGRAAASIWLGSVGAFFAILALALIGTGVAWFVIALIIVIVAALVLADVAVIRDVRRLVGPMSSNSSDAVMRRRFTRIVVAEIVAFPIANTILSLLRRYELITPVDVLIVGVHFLPLAWLFGVPRYYGLGIGFCIAVVMTMVFVPSTAHIGRASAWFAWISVSCGVMAIVSAVGNTLEARHAVRIARMEYSAAQ